MYITPQAGDSVAAIAAKTLGDPGRFREIADLNEISIFEPIIGKQLKIPTLEQAAAMVLEYIKLNNQTSPNDPENLLEMLDLSGLRDQNSDFGSLPHQLITWLAR